MTEQELKEVIAMLHSSGMAPMLCDTPVPYTGQMVRAGIPSMPGDPSYDDYIMLPKELVGRCPMLFVDVDGDSMMDAGIMPGDRLRVKVCDTAEDGDIVIAWVDGECTLKAYLHDEQGRRWLVPRNEKYAPIALREDMDVRILGRVVEHIRQTPRISHSDMMRSVNRIRQTPAFVPSQRDDVVAEIVAEVAPMVKCKRQWYAVYRALIDCGLMGQDMYVTFADLVQKHVSQHPFLPKAEILRRMAVQSFRHPVAKWDCADAPVSGSRFEEYMRIARTTMVAGARK